MDFANVDNYDQKLQDSQPLIINTDLSNGEGIHWIVLYPKDGTLYVIDPLGPKNYRPYDNVFSQVASQSGLTIKYFPGRFQFNNSQECGWFAIYVAKLLQKTNGDPFNIVKSTFGRTADRGDQTVLKNAFGTNGGQLKKLFK